MDAACTIQDSIHVFSLVHKYVSRILGTYHFHGILFNVFYIDIFYTAFFSKFFMIFNSRSA